MATYYGDRYRQKKKLSSEGNMSSIYLCVDTDYEDDEGNEKYVVLKLLDKPCNGDENLQKKVFQREVESLELLHHKNIVQILDKGLDERYGAYYIVLEYIQGKSFKDLSYELFSYEYAQKIELMEQVLNGLEYLHRKGVIHRDIKPSNLMLTQDGTVKIIDFGISKLSDTFYSDYTLAGFVTKAYCSPEQYAGKTISAQSDIYSLGLVFYEILAAEHIVTRETMDFCKVPVSIQEILKKMLYEEASLRYNSITNVLSDLRTEYSKFSQTQYISLRHISKIAQRLYETGYIARAESALAQALLEKEFAGKCYIRSCRNRETNVFDNSFDILGKQFSSHVVIDNMSGSVGFTIVGIRFHDPAMLFSWKENAYEIPYLIKVSSYSRPRDASEVSAQEFCDEVLEHEAEASVQLHADMKQKDIISKWDRILELQRRRIDQIKATLHYTNFEYNDHDNTITIMVNPDAEVEFSSDDILEMTSARKSSRSIEIGRLRNHSHGKMIIDPLPEANVENIAKQGNISISKRMEEISLQRQSKALKSIQFGENVNPAIGNVIFAPKSAKSKGNLRLALQDCRSSLIDQSKLTSLEKALSAECLFLLQGPPGTGKTTFITELVWQILNGNESMPGQPDAKILITSQSHVAVDHSLNKIKQLIPDANVIRIGILDKLSETSREFTLDAFCRKWTDEVVSKCKEALELYKAELHLDDSLQEKNGIIAEIDRLVEEVSNLSAEIHRVDSDIDLVDILEQKWEHVNDRISSMRDMLHDQSESITDDVLLRILTAFSTDLDALNSQLFSVVQESIVISQKKQALEQQRDELQSSAEQKRQDIASWMQILDVATDEEYLAAKASVAEALSENEAKYQQYTKIEQLCLEWQKRVRLGDGLLQESINDATIVGATCLGIASLATKVDFVFDWVIVDEAGKATPSEIMVPICLGKKVVLVGDHKQLPPVVDENLLSFQQDARNPITKGDLETSLFEHLEKELPVECKSILSEQYRMNPVIGDLISEQFYDGLLVSRTKKESKSVPLPFFNDRSLVWLTTCNNPDRKEECLGSYGAFTYRNTCEVKVIFDYLRLIDTELKQHGLRKEVAIIAGYSGQRNELNRQLESKYRDQFSNLSVEINTVDAFQGRETDIVFYSVVRSNENGNLGFLKDARRLNVAFSRARELLIVVGDHSCAQHRNTIEGQPNPFVGIISYMYSHKDDCLVKEV